MTIELQNETFFTSMQGTIDLRVFPEQLKNEGSRYNGQRIGSLLSPTTADESSIQASLTVGIPTPSISTSAYGSPSDSSSNYSADSWNLSQEKLPRLFSENGIPQEPNQAIDESHTPQNLVHQLYHINSGTIHPQEKGKLLESDDESSSSHGSASKFGSDKEQFIEQLPQVLVATGAADMAEVRSDQELVRSDSQHTVSKYTQKISFSANGMDYSPCNPNTSFGSDKAIYSLFKPDHVKQLEENSAKNLHTSPERVSKDLENATKALIDKPVKQCWETSFGKLDKKCEQPSGATENGHVEKKSAKTSPNKPLRSSPSKLTKPNASGSAGKTEAVQKFTITDTEGKESQNHPSTSPDKPVKGSAEKVTKQKQYPPLNKQFDSNGSSHDSKAAGSPNSANMTDTIYVRQNLGSLSISPSLFKLAKFYKAPADDPSKALQYALQSVIFFEKNSDKYRSLELVMSLHVLAAIHCRLGQYEEAIVVLERSLALSNSTSQSEHALASFSGYMQLGDTFALLGRHESSVDAYHAALKLQKQALGELDPRVGDTCRYLAEAHLQAMQFQEAEIVCQHLLNIHSMSSYPGSVEEAADRRLMALICSGKGDHENALEYLVLASMALISDGQDLEAASVQASIGDTHVSLERFDDAVFAYQKSLTVFKSVKGEDHASVASVYVSLANLYMKTGRHREAKIYCENALRIYSKLDAADVIASGLTEIATIYEAMNDPGQALHLLQNALDMVKCSPGQQIAMAGIEAQMGVLHYLQGKPTEAYLALKDAVFLLKSASQKRASFMGILLNQMGLACVELNQIVDAAEVFEEAKDILQETCGPDHPDTLAVCSNLAGTYHALGRKKHTIFVE
ncbi:hypothetical protein O6H91_02G100400 [Diphasiastrum complanatum]|uniref:Uncharacterized protein n=1 Tax=Diphasiastrum complanatum TaxID=34168 RepID=A0ACC2EJ08_DIPCM|nr:hypothetical protein O6H91_02G100400 [Diphasiastrum complanatum]